MMKNGQKMEPMELADYTGIDVTSSCQEYYHLHLAEEYGPSETARRLMKEGHLGKKTGSGYYVWPVTGRPKIDPALYTGRYDPDIPNFIQANEACKLYEEGVCSLEECDLAIRLGYNMEGPIEYIRRFEPEKVTAVLEGLAGRCHKEIFRPVDTIRSGAYKQKQREILSKGEDNEKARNNDCQGGGQNDQGRDDACDHCNDTGVSEHVDPERNREKFS